MEKVEKYIIRIIVSTIIFTVGLLPSFLITKKINREHSDSSLCKKELLISLNDIKKKVAEGDTLCYTALKHYYLSSDNSAELVYYSILISLNYNYTPAFEDVKLLLKSIALDCNNNNDKEHLNNLADSFISHEVQSMTSF